MQSDPIIMPQEPVIQTFLQQKLNPRRTTASVAHSLTKSPNVSKLRSATNAHSTITTAKHLTPPNRTPRTQTFTDTDNNRVHSKIERHQKRINLLHRDALFPQTGPPPNRTPSPTMMSTSRK
ncbi:hypothetical protein M758_UG085700 [Ceratodon purpureus]|nr:hypothetical protein M758_UG085700 [Ceratodon purpureus]